MVLGTALGKASQEEGLGMASGMALGMELALE